MNRRNALFRLTAAYRRKIATGPPNCMSISGAILHTVSHWITPIQSEPPESARQPGSPMSAGMRKLLLQLDRQFIMGDKSPKSKQKSKDQKQGKSNASAKEKQRVIDSKHQVPAAPPKKKG